MAMPAGTVHVDLVGDGFEWLSLLGPLLIAGAAYLAARIAAQTANSRQRSQLDHDRELQRDQLDHDRMLRDRDELRVVLDEAIWTAVEGAKGIASLAAIREIADERAVHLAEIVAQDNP